MALTACGGGSELLIIPLFEFIFQTAPLAYNGVTYNVQLSLQPTNPTTPTGSFTGGNLSLDAAPFSYTVAGTYDGCSMTLVVGNTAVAPIARSYNGRFTSNDTLVLKDSSGTSLPDLVFTRNPAGSRNMGCG